jgi:protease PrsW
MSPPTVVLLSVTAALIPTLLYGGIIYWFDRYEKEPMWLLTAAFVWGAIPSILLAFFFNTLLSVPLYLLAGEDTGNILAASLVGPPVEESIKGLALIGILFLWRTEIDSVLDGIIYGAMVGLGFAMVENVFYFVAVYNEGGQEAWQMNIFIRGVVFGLNHALFTGITGLGIALARLSHNPLTRWAAPVAGWMVATFLHFLHNLTVSFGNLLCLVALIFDWGGVWLLLVIVVWALAQERRWIRDYLQEEVAMGALTISQYENACSGRRRTGHHFRLLRAHGPRAYLTAMRFYQRCSQLAYKKHHFMLFRDEKSRRLIEELRSEVVTLGRELI